MKKLLKSVSIFLTVGLVSSLLLTSCSSETKEKPTSGSSDTSVAASKDKETSSSKETGSSEASKTDGGAATAGMKIAVVCKALDSEFWMDVKKGAEDAGKELGVEVYVAAADKESNVEGQFKIIEDLIQQKYDAICIAPSDSEGVIPIVEEAAQKGIKVLAIDTDMDTGEKLSYVGTDNKLGGEMAANFLLELLKDKPGAKVAIISGVPGQQTQRDRIDGFRSIMDGSELDLVDEQPANSDPGLAMTVMENMLTTHPDLAGVFITNATMAIGSLEAIGNIGKEDLFIVSFDSSTDVLEAIVDGKISAAVAQSPYNMGKYAVENAFKALNGETIETVIDTGTEIISKDNVKDYLK